MNQLFLIILLTGFITFSVSYTCKGLKDTNIQLQKALLFTRTTEFNDLFQKVRNSEEWKAYSSYMADNFNINIENILQNSNPNDTLKTFRNKMMHNIPLSIKLRFIFAPGSLDFHKVNALYEPVKEMPEVVLITEKLCNLNVNIDELVAALI